ncbi:Hypp2673 [Branchiostoma lanceolatum]|uniref:Hypp2673 protein n=1 Tax=Branchiostoma lanceolatum TaxID=7740 RepID=A0A8J9ZTJ1_BRALA|nr:Hypp2673 [Branchiostoma lanceolatum]
MKDVVLVIILLFQAVIRTEGDWTSVLNVTRTGREGDVFTERTDTCTEAWNGYCSQRYANRLSWREPGGRRVCMCQCYTWFNTYLSDEDSCENVPSDSDCEWTFEDEGPANLYTVTTGAGQTGRIDWGDEDWPGSGVTPNSCSIDWSCDVTSQTYLEDGEWKDLSCLGGDIPDDIFILDYEENGRKRNCQRHWFVSWDVTYDITRLGGLVIHLDITCTRRRFGNRQYTESQCLRFKTEGTHLYTPGPGCTAYTQTTPPGKVTTQRNQQTTGSALETPDAGITRAPDVETTHSNTTSGNGDMGRNTGGGGGNTGAIAGGVVVAVIAVLALLGGFVFFWRRKHKQDTGKPSSGGPQVSVSTLQNPGYRVNISAPQINRISSDSSGYVDNTAYVGYSTGGSVDNAIYEGQQQEYAYTDVVVPSAPKRDATYQPYQPYDQVPHENLYNSPDADNVYAQLDGTQEQQVPSAPPLPFAGSEGTNHYTSLMEGQENLYQDLGPQYEELPAYTRGTDSDPSSDKSKSPHGFL